MNRALPPLLVLSLGVLLGSGCRNAPDERASAAAPGVAASAATQSQNSARAAVTGSSASSAGDAQSKSSVGQCTQDQDCTLTRFIPGACCQDCEERPILRSELEAKDAECAEALARCPMRNCAPGRRSQRVACVAGTCQLAGAGARN